MLVDILTTNLLFFFFISPENVSKHGLCLKAFVPRTSPTNAPTCWLLHLLALPGEMEGTCALHHRTLPSCGSFHHSRPWSCPGSRMSGWAKTLFPLFLKEVYQDWENHKAGLKSLHGEREQTFLTNWTTAPLCLLSDIWTPECKMGTIRVFPERNWKIERDPREGSQDILHLPRWSSWAITMPGIRAERVHERSSPTSLHPQYICGARAQLRLSEDCFTPSSFQERSLQPKT